VGEAGAEGWAVGVSEAAAALVVVEGPVVGDGNQVAT